MSHSTTGNLKQGTKKIQEYRRARALDKIYCFSVEDKNEIDNYYIYEGQAWYRILQMRFFLFV